MLIHEKVSLQTLLRMPIFDFLLVAAYIIATTLTDLSTFREVRFQQTFICAL